MSDSIMKEVSVIIPCYNAEEYVDECLDSLINQTIGIQCMDIIVVDDASTDSSREHILKYQYRYPKSIKLIQNVENMGQANARNIGMDNAKTSYITFVDADDWVEPDLYEKLLLPARKYNCDIVACCHIQHIEGLEPKYCGLGIPEKLYQIDDIEARKEFLSGGGMPRLIGTALIRTSYLTDNDIRFKSFRKYEDNYWAATIAYSFTSYYPVHFYGYHYRILENSNCHSKNDVVHFERLNVELELLKYFIEKGLFNTFYEEIRDGFLQKFYVNTLHIICCQFDYFPLEQVEMMQSVVREVFPDYLDYCKKSKRFINPVLTVAFNFSLDTWIEYKNAYYAWCDKGEELDIAQFYHKMRNTLSIT